MVIKFWGSVTWVRPASAKAKMPISSIVFGNWIVFRLLQSSNTFLGIFVKDSFSGRTTSFSAVHPEKTPSPIALTVLGSLIVSSWDTEAKASLPTKVTFWGRITSFSASLSLKAPSPIVVISLRTGSEEKSRLCSWVFFHLISVFLSSLSS